MSTHPIHLMLADVDGTLITPEKVLTPRAITAVQALRQAGVHFVVTSGRPPRGMQMLVKPLQLDTPIAAFNGGAIVAPDMRVIEQHTLPDALVSPITKLIGSFKLDVWIYQGTDWFVPDPEGAHVAREAATVQFSPKVMHDIAQVSRAVLKIVGVSNDHEAVTRAAGEVHDRFGDHVAASPSQPYYLDVTHPNANKGSVARYMARRYQLSTDDIATIGDMPNDVLMFAHSGLSIAMGNADPQVKRAARRITAANSDEGFAKAVERFVLPAASAKS